ncbi:homoserine O-acetyltransferase [Alteromonas aestuariivivens]|uniref:Probable acyltransferase n=1 Tax=Alteromonas aestuariivivens TaxID=1938339 RepID=A0A3D8M4X4_9ALTE|nr:homoserine O-acetyltransferase [Alteromonas aestuariivivens]RDV24595.1 homoserine O-acetyltransferase [Alteromonas aestuariivivens]
MQRTLKLVTGLWLLSLVQIGAVAKETAAPALLTEKQTFEMSDFQTFGGKIIERVRVGWESYGQMNADKDNVVLVTHYFSGTSHAAGKYHPDDTTPGYWDAIIGPGKAIDTNRFFVVSVDSLANLNAYDANVITTGPASINPATGKPYGLTFPVVTIRDFVNVQKAVLESLGIKRLHAVVGPSMGSMQALEWATAYPDWVDRMVSVIGAGESDAWTTAALEQWATPIRLDPNWQQGNYSAENRPDDGLAAALALITQQALHPQFFARQGQQLGYSPVEQGPLEDINSRHSIVNWLFERAHGRAKKMDANHLLYLVRACQLFVAGHNGDLATGLKTVTAKTLFMPASSDLLLMPYLAQSAHNKLTAQGKHSDYQELHGELGHLEGVLDVSEQAQTLKTFLEN